MNSAWAIDDLSPFSRLRMRLRLFEAALFGLPSDWTQTGILAFMAKSADGVHGCTAFDEGTNWDR